MIHNDFNSDSDKKRYTSHEEVDRIMTNLHKRYQRRHLQSKPKNEIHIHRLHGINRIAAFCTIESSACLYAETRRH